MDAGKPSMYVPDREINLTANAPENTSQIIRPAPAPRLRR